MTTIRTGSGNEAKRETTQSIIHVVTLLGFSNTINTLNNFIFGSFSTNVLPYYALHQILK